MRPKSRRQKPNPPLRIAALIASCVVFVSVGYAFATSLTHADLVRPSLEVSALPGEIADRVAASDVLYIPRADQNAALRRLTKSAEPLFCAGTKKYAALTFDDGPSATTPKLLRMLRKYGIPATFFTLGRQIQQYPQYARLLTAQGAVGNHSWDHPFFTTLSSDEIKQEIAQTSQAIVANTGPPYRMVRPPYGARNPMVEATIRKQGYAEILWSADSQDALNGSPQLIVRNTLDGLGPGSVILLHDRPPNTLKALKKILPAIHRSGLTMVTVPQLLAVNPPSDAQLAAGPHGCTAAGKVNVSGYFAKPKGE